jgi:SNF2 family DNA or RNA helicase
VTTGGAVDITFSRGRDAVGLSCGSEVSDSTWLQIRAIWPAATCSVDRSLNAPVAEFFARKDSLARVTRSAGCSIALDEGARELIEGVNHVNANLPALLRADSVPTEVDVDQALRGGRFERELRSFQRRDLAKLLALPNGANFSVPGAGKTSVTLALYEAQHVAGRISRLLVVAPLSAFGAWLEETSQCFSPGLDAERFVGGQVSAKTEVLLVNYQRLNSGYIEIANWVAAEPTMIVLDEAHRMKRGYAGQWGTACLSLAYLARRRDILTGTPAPQSPGDLEALFEFVWPTQSRLILPRSAGESAPAAADAANAIAKSISPLFTRTTKDELILPSLTRTPVCVPLEGLQREIYMALRSQFAGELSVTGRTNRDFARMGRVVMYLLEAATNPKLLAAGSVDGCDVFRFPPLDIPAGSDLRALLEQYNEYETPAKFRVLARMVKANADAGKKTLVWSNFVRNLNLLAAQLALYEPAVIHGGIEAYAEEGVSSRETEIERFRFDPSCMVMLANPAAMSEGISLHQQCHDAIYLDRTFNAGQFLQSIDRIHRLGLGAGVKTRVSFLITQETIDLRVNERLGQKEELMRAMLSDPGFLEQSLPDEDDYGQPIDADLDAESLFAHLAGP